jgi:hypothetical protein
MQGTDQPLSKHDLRTQAVQAAAQACDDHATAPDTLTLRTMQDRVQHALNLRATPNDIRQARATAVNA